MLDGALCTANESPAAESNAYEIAFFLLKTYEDQIYLQYQKALDAHVKSYKILLTQWDSGIHIHGWRWG